MPRPNNAPTTGKVKLLASHPTKTRLRAEEEADKKQQEEQEEDEEDVSEQDSDSESESGDDQAGDAEMVPADANGVVANGEAEEAAAKPKRKSRKSKKAPKKAFKDLTDEEKAVVLAARKVRHEASKAKKAEALESLTRPLNIPLPSVSKIPAHLSDKKKAAITKKIARAYDRLQPRTWNRKDKNGRSYQVTAVSGLGKLGCFVAQQRIRLGIAAMVKMAAGDKIKRISDGLLKTICRYEEAAVLDRLMLGAKEIATRAKAHSIQPEDIRAAGLIFSNQVNRETILC